LNKTRKVEYILPRLSFCYTALYVILFLGVLASATPLSEIVINLALPVIVFATSDNDEDDEQQQEEEQQEELGDSSGAQPQPQPQPAQAQLEDFIVGGKINSVLPVGNNTWISDGNWNIVVESGDAKMFRTQMIWTSADGTKSHTHDFQNFVLSPDSDGIVMSPNTTLLLEGELDVATNGVIEWEGVPAAIYVGNGQTIAMTVDDEATNSHFGGQPIYGLVTSFMPCGSSGPNMEVSPPCE
jgi:hypothetical protein